MLRLSIDERESDDVSGEADSIPFVTSEDFAEQYGNSFNIALDENHVPCVEVAS